MSSSSRPTPRRALALTAVLGIGLGGAVLFGLSGNLATARVAQQTTADASGDATQQPEGTPSTHADDPGAGTEGAQGSAQDLVAIDLPDCEGQGSSGTPTSPSTATVDPRTRTAAQQGLDFLSSASVSWQQTNDCYGCHVQAVTTEALAVGQHHAYEVSATSLEAMVAGLTTAKGGTQSAGGLQYHGGSLLLPSKAFGGAALARYDSLVGNELTDDLLTVAEELRGFQQDDGAVHDPESWVNLPVGQGSLQFTWQAIATWRQAYERSADPRWLTSVALAEDWLHGQVSPAGQDSSLQPTIYVLLGLADAGASMSEGSVQGLVDDLMSRQDASGGWASHRGGSAGAFSTGQALLTLRTLGLGEDHPAVSKGSAWLLDQQLEDGSWGHGGDEKATAMWAVLGLVKVDAVQFELTGISHGAHIEGSVGIEAKAISSEGTAIQGLQLTIDDVPVAAECGSSLAFGLDTASLSPGPHVVDLVATDVDGRTTRRRLDVYTGAHYLVDLGSSWDDGGTLLSFRNLASESRSNSVRLQIRPLTLKAGEEPVAGEVIAKMSAPGSQGAMRFWWDGGELAEAGLGPDTRFQAELSFLDESGAVVQSTTTDFVHADPAAVAQWYGEVGGKVDLPDDRGAANTWVELVDQTGNVLDRVRTTKEGQYRFKEVQSGDYNVRVDKKGYGSLEAPVSASPAEETEQDLEF